jgi:hypothetical protein
MDCADLDMIELFGSTNVTVSEDFSESPKETTWTSALNLVNALDK